MVQHLKMAEEIVIAVAIDEIADFAVRLVNTETALQTIIFSTKEMLGDDDCLGKLLKEIAADATSVLSYPKLKPYAKKIAEATIERNDARNALDRVEEASKDIYLTPAQLKYDVGIRFKQQEAAFEIERGIWRKSEKEFKMAFDTMNARIEQIEMESKWAYGKIVFHPIRGYGRIASDVFKGEVHVLFDYITRNVSGNQHVKVKLSDIQLKLRHYWPWTIGDLCSITNSNGVVVHSVVNNNVFSDEEVDKLPDFVYIFFDTNCVKNCVRFPLTSNPDVQINVTSTDYANSFTIHRIAI